MIDPFAEFAAALDATYATPAVIEWLDRRGLTRERRQAVGGVAVMRATLSRPTCTFEPHPDGVRVLITPVWSGRATLAHSDPLDVLAWCPAAPAEHYLRLGVATVLGAGGLGLARRTGSPLRLYRTAEAYIVGGGEGAEWPAGVLLVPALAWRHLSDLPGIIADDVDHGIEVEQFLLAGRPALPPIRIVRREAAAA